MDLNHTSHLPHIGNSTEMPIPAPNYDSGDIAWVLISTGLVFLMIPGVGYFYSGMAKINSALSLINLSFWSIAIVSIQWYLFGYSLTFSTTGSEFIGDFSHFALNGIIGTHSPVTDKIPAILFVVYQGMFAAITPALVLGACAMRNRFLPTLVFIFVWTTLVYDFIANWTWNPNGWGNKMGGLDFAGGSPVHIASGAAALAYSIMVGKRKEHKEELTPHNMSTVFMGTAFLWFGWFGFNGGSALAGNEKAVMACVVTNIAASVGAIVWVLLDYRHEKKFSALGFCAGAVSGLVCITPAAGYVSPSSALVFGLFGGVCCNLALKLKHLLHYDDALDVFGVHGVGGIIGNLLTAIFAQKRYAYLGDKFEIEGGWLDGNWFQMVHQLADTFAALGWSFVVTIIILFTMNKIPGLSLRADEETLRNGLDQGEMGTACYEYVEEMKKNGSFSNGNGVINKGMERSKSDLEMTGF